jgi:hypothetical protein
MFRMPGWRIEFSNSAKGVAAVSTTFSGGLFWKSQLKVAFPFVLWYVHPPQVGITGILVLHVDE